MIRLVSVFTALAVVLACLVAKTVAQTCPTKCRATLCVWETDNNGQYIAYEYSQGFRMLTMTGSLTQVGKITGNLNRYWVVKAGPKECSTTTQTTFANGCNGAEVVNGPHTTLELSCVDPTTPPEE